MYLNCHFYDKDDVCIERRRFLCLHCGLWLDYRTYIHGVWPFAEWKYHICVWVSPHLSGPWSILGHDTTSQDYAILYSADGNLPPDGIRRWNHRSIWYIVCKSSWYQSWGLAVILWNCGENKATIDDMYWQTKTGRRVVSNLPGITPMKPGRCTLSLLGIDAVVLDTLTAKPQE